MNKSITITAALFGMIAVMTGAFGAHGLKTMIAADELQIWHTGVEYNFYHAFALLFLAVHRLHRHLRPLLRPRTAALHGAVMEPFTVVTAMMLVTVPGGQPTAELKLANQFRATWVTLVPGRC